MDRDELLAQYEATGDETAFGEAKTLYEQALAESPDDADLHMNYGYLLECHARNQLRQAAAHYERAIELNPIGIKAHYYLIGARAGLQETEIPIAMCERRLGSAPDDLDSYRLLAAAYLAGHLYEKARRVIEAGLAIAPNDGQLIENRGDVRAGTGDPEGPWLTGSAALSWIPRRSPRSTAAPSFSSAKDGSRKPWTPGASSSTGPKHRATRWIPCGRSRSSNGYTKSPLP